MITPADCLAKYGEPTPRFEQTWMEIWRVPDDIHEFIKPMPKVIYLNKDLKQPLWNAILLVIHRGLAAEVDEWDGCFVIRKQRKSTKQSIHSWGIAIDINMSTNQLYQVPSMSPELVACFTECGFDWGGLWQRKDGMHFQLSKI